MAQHHRFDWSVLWSALAWPTWRWWASPMPSWVSACAPAWWPRRPHPHAGARGDYLGRQRQGVVYKPPKHRRLLPALPRKPVGKVLTRDLRELLGAQT